MALANRLAKFLRIRFFQGMLSTNHTRKISSAMYYKQTSYLQKEDGMKLIDVFSPKMGDHILDLSCGTGFLTDILAERVGQKGKVIAVDPDSERISIAKDCYGGKTNIKFVVGSDKDFPEGEYDGIFSNSTIHWIEDQTTAFRRVYKNLIPGGTFAFTTLNDPNFPDIVYQIFSVFGPQTVQATMGAFHWKSDKYYKTLAASIGFAIKCIKTNIRPVYFSSLESFIDFLYGLHHGEFDRSSPALNELKRQHEGHSFHFTIPRLYVILVKPF